MSEVEDFESVEDTTKIYLNLDSYFLTNKLKLSLYDSLRVGKRKVKYVIFTYHVYKNLSDKDSIRVSKLSYISDKLRKWDSFARFVIVKEQCEDGYPHYHGIARIDTDQFGRYAQLPSIKGCKVWQKEFATGVSFQWIWEEEYKYSDDTYHTHDTHKWHVISSNGVEERNASFKGKWMKYGIWRYILYITKYLTGRSVKFSNYYVSS